MYGNLVATVTSSRKCKAVPKEPCKKSFAIDHMHWRHVSITTTPCWGSRLVVLRARVVLAERVDALSLSVSARARPSPAVWHAGVGPLAACLAMAHVAVPRLTPNTRGRPSVTSYAYGLYGVGCGSLGSYGVYMTIASLCSCYEFYMYVALTGRLPRITHNSHAQAQRSEFGISFVHASVRGHSR